MSGITITGSVTINRGVYIGVPPPPAAKVLSLDAGNPASYPGSGATWTDTVGSIPFTLVNSPTYNSADGGYIQFNPGSGQYGFSTTNLGTLANWSIEVWHYYDGTNTGAAPNIFTEYQYAGGTINLGLGSAGGGDPDLQAWWYGAGFHATTPYTLTPGNWYQIVGTFDGSTLKLYVNNTLVQTQTGQGPGGAANPAIGYGLMTRWDPGGLWGGKLAIVNIYDNALSAGEVNTSWNANKARFGLGPPTFSTPTIMNSGAFVSLLQPCASAINTSGLITVIGSDNGNSGSAVSSNGTSWTGPTQEITGSTFLTHITWSSYHNYFLAIGVNSSSNAICSTSSDGVTWTTPSVISGAVPIGNVYAITVNSAGLFVAIMILNPGGIAYSTSTDGSTWTTPTALPGAASGVFFNTASIAVNSSGKFVVTGYNGFDTTPWYSVSTNGSSWTTQQMFNSTFQPKAVVWSSFHNLFVTVGNMTSGIGYSTSTNGSTWTTPALISGSTSAMLIVALAVSPTGEFVGVGQLATGGIGQALYITSENGAAWTAPSLFNGSTNAGYMRSVVYSTLTNSFVAVGFDNTGPNWLYAITT